MAAALEQCAGEGSPISVATKDEAKSADFTREQPLSTQSKATHGIAEAWAPHRARYLDFQPVFWESRSAGGLHEYASIADNFVQSLRSSGVCADQDKLPRFYRNEVLSVVWSANVLELGTLGPNPASTQRMLREMLTSPAAGKSVASSASSESGEWLASGRGNSAEQWCWLARQSLRAWMILQDAAKENTALSVNLIVRVHRTLMKGAKADDGRHSVGMVAAGELRTEGVRAGDYVFPRADLVPCRLEKLINEFEARLEAGHAVEAAALLLLDFVSLHPFMDGNGRTCRFLFAYALMRAGFPFPVVFSSGHSKAREHYLRALVAAQQRRHYWGIYAMAWASVMRSIRNYQVFSL